MYLRFVALGDSATFGIGDRVPGGWRGWSRLLAEGMRERQAVSYCNVAAPGSTAADVRHGQLDAALRHRPDVASIMVGLNDTMRSTWHPGRLREDLLHTADALHREGSLLLTVGFHDHGQVFGLRGPIARALGARVDAVNAVVEEVHQTFDTVHVDLSSWPDIRERSNWSVDRLHPSELGHRALARAFARLLPERGVEVAMPSAHTAGGLRSSPVDNARTVATEVIPWLGRRARDLGPWAAQAALAQGRRPLRAR